MFVYLLYFLLVLRTRKKTEYLTLIGKALDEQLDPLILPYVSIIIPTFNEEDVISRKLQNIAALDYPREKIEILVIDDCSTDKTVEIAQVMFDKLQLSGKVVKKSTRSGVNSSYNLGFTESKGELILTTDADVTFDADALVKAVKVLKAFKNAGGITGKMVPVSKCSTSAVTIENLYRGFFDHMSVAESAIYSTFPGYTCFTLLKKSAFAPLPLHYGSSDGNISFATIRKGLKFLYVPSIVFYEPISFKVREQIKQKIRRATRLIQSTLANKDLIFKAKYESFGRIILPLRFAMMTVLPILFFVGIIAIFLAFLQLSMVIALLFMGFLLLCIFVGALTRLPLLSLLSSFVFHQFYLLVGLFLSWKGAAVWKPIDRGKVSFKKSS
jgi:cellulose synthase/poly-beta-1,6-N-acetylglucosamine synthase-like glycosyltransferase